MTGWDVMDLVVAFVAGILVGLFVAAASRGKVLPPQGESVKE